MLAPRWRSVLRDLWQNRARTLLVVLSIALGMFAIGTIAQMYLLVTDDLAASYAAVHPAHATVFTDDPFDAELVQVVRRMDGVAAAEGRRSVVLRFRRAPADPWLPIELTALDDYEDIAVNVVRPESTFGVDPQRWPAGAWPPPDDSIVLERTSLLVDYLGLTQAELGDTIQVRTPDDRTRNLRLSGVSYDFARLPATFAGHAIGYVTFDTLEWLGQPRSFNELHIRVQQPHRATQIEQVADAVRDRVERSGREVTRVELHQPGKLPLHDFFQALTLILGVAGVLALLLSLVLVGNTVSALLTRQVRQIGIMKAVGARTSQIVRLYLGMVLLFGLLALLLALPTTWYAVTFFVEFLAFFLNFQPSAVRLTVPVLLLMLVTGLLLPLLAALLPIVNGTRVSVRVALSSTGTGVERFGKQRLDRLLQRVRGLPRPVLLALRNTSRRRVRFVLTLVTLTLGSTLVIAVLSVRGALFLTYDDILQAARHDVEVFFEHPERIPQIMQATQQVAGITAVECWSSASVYRMRQDGSESALFDLVGLPADTALFQPELIVGRWLLPEDERAVVVTTHLLAEEPDLVPGATLELATAPNDTSTWTVVGVVRSPLPMPILYADYAAVTRMLGEPNHARSVRVVTEASTPYAQAVVAETLQARFEAVGVRVAAAQTQAQLREQSTSLFTIITAFLLSMALLVAGVGGLGLMGTLSINVLERTREIGILRAIGAANRQVQTIVITEGLVVGLLSWLIGLLLALPLSGLLCYGIGLALLQLPLQMHFAWEGALLWLGVLLLIATGASVLPAAQATRLTVRDALAHE
jgi:putative ABC transport system permease protein